MPMLVTLIRFIGTAVETAYQKHSLDIAIV